MHSLFHFKNLFKLGFVGFFLSVIFFLLWPEFDLTVTHLLYDDSSRAFYFDKHIITDFIYSFTHIIAVSIFIIIPILFVASYLFKHAFLVNNRRAFIFLACSFLLGPGLVVNSLLKDHYERPRPYQTIDFGGKEQFESPFQPKFECPECYSFVSGHASVGFYFFAFTLLLGKKRWFWLPMALGGIIGGTRILQGGHYLSDVIFSGWVVWFCTLLLYYLFFKDDLIKRLK